MVLSYRALAVTLAAVVTVGGLTVIPGARAEAAEPAAHAPASLSKTVIDVTKGTAIAIVGDGQRLALGSRNPGDSTLIAAEDSLLAVPTAGSAAPLNVDAAQVTVPAGATAAPGTLVLEQVTGPQGATFTATDSAGITVLGSDKDAPHSLAVTAGSTQTVGATFSAAGRYTVKLHAELPVTGSDGATRTLSSAAQTFTVTVGGVAYQSATTLTATAQDDHAELTATVTPAGAVGAVEFSDGDDYLGYTPVSTAGSSSTATLKTGTLAGGAHTFRAVFVPTWVTDFTSSAGTASLTVGDPGPQTAAASSSASTAPRPDASSGSSAAPSTTSTRAAVAAVAPAAVGAGPVVISAGNVSFTPKISGLTSIDRNHGSFQSFQMGLLDKTDHNYANQRWYAPDEAVLHLGAGNSNGDGTWSTASNVIDYDSDPCEYDDDGNIVDPSCYDDWINNSIDAATGNNTKLLLGPDQASADGGINSSFYKAAANLSYSLSSATTPPNGRFQLAEDDGTIGWDTALLDGSGTQAQERTGTSAKTDFWATRFTAPGTYCLTVAGSLTQNDRTGLSTTETATYTVIVGDLPTTITTCAQPGNSGGGGTGDGWHDEDQFSTNGDVTVLKSGHLDTRAWLNSAGNGLDVGVLPNTPNHFIDSHDLVLTGLVPGTVPQSTAGADFSFIGPAGSTYWYWPESQVDGYLWPGFSTENWKSAQLSGTHDINLTLDGVHGPGDVVLYQDDGLGHLSSMLYSSRRGTPAAYSWNVPLHSHTNWAFTQQGRYCLNFNASTQLANGTWIHGSGMLTAWVGDPSQAKTVTPCDRDTTPPIGTLPSASPVPTSNAVMFDTANGELDLQAEFAAGHLDLPARVYDSVAASGTYRDMDDLVISFPRGIVANEWKPYEWQQVFLDTSRLPWGSVDGDVTVSLGATRGPGTAALYAPKPDSPGELVAVQSRAFGPSVKEDLALRVTKPGVYCVPLTVTATPAGSGQVSSVTKTLTVVAGSTNPADASYVDRSTVTSCSRGQQPGSAGSTSGDDSGGVPESAWNVPNESLTDSGAVILNNGHVDVASKVSGDTLQTWVKDTTETSDARYHPLSGSNSLQSPDRNSTNNGNGTVFQVLPGAAKSVPSDSQYRFLGSAGSTIWQVSQVQEKDLLWPGWSTEEVPLSSTQTGVTWTLNKMTGPGEFALYTADPIHFNQSDVLFNSRDGITSADSFTIPKNSHVHGNWAFSAEGTYCLGFTRSTTMADGAAASDSFTLAVAVGRVNVRKVDPGKCFLDAGKPSSTDASPISESSLTDATTGGVSVLDGGAGFFPGQLVSVNVGASHAGAWVSLWLQSQPVWLGWAKADDTGVVQVRLPVDTALGSHKLVVKSQAGDLLGWAGVSVVAAPVTDAGTQQTGVTAPVTQLAPQCTSAGPGVSVISAGHLDWNTQVIGGKLRSLIGDDSTGTRLYRDPATTVLWLKPSSQVSLPAGFDRVGAAGSVVWQVPQTQNQDLIWLGWSTELLNAGNASSPVNWSLTQVDGPGTLKVYTIGSFGDLQEMVFNGPGTHTLPLGVHVHANWAFSAQGVYRLHFTQSATLANGQASSDSEVLTIAVGNANPATALSKGTGCGAVVRSVLATGQVAPTAGQAQAQADAGQAQDGTSSGGSQAARTDLGTASRRADSPVPLLLGVLGGLLLLAAAGTGILWWRRRNTA